MNMSRWAFTPEEAGRIGQLTEQVEGWTDQELKQMIQLEELVLAFLDGKGAEWWLAKAPLFRELQQFKGFAEARMKDRKPY
jgi:hypothetical protein